MFLFDINTFWDGTKSTDDYAASGPVLPTPHGKWFHPEKKIAEKIISFILELLLPFVKVTSCQSIFDATSDPETQESLRCFRRSMNTTGIKEYEAVVTKMKQKYQWEKAAYHDIPRKQNILIDWGIVNDYSILTQTNGEQVANPIAATSAVTVYVHGPSKFLFQPKDEGDKEASSRGSLSKVLRLSYYPTVPIMVWIHGGGMICMSAKDGRGLAYCGDLLAFQRKKRQQAVKEYSLENKGGEIQEQHELYPDMVVVNVEYGLAPEHPFPNGVIDCLSVIEHLIELYPSNPIHVAGESAGGNLTSVVAFECARKYPGRISSAFIMQPMLTPAADTVSYHMNSRSSFIPGDWLRWCWRAYISFDNDRTKKLSNSREIHIYSYEKSKWMTNKDENTKNWVRLFAPQTNLPNKEELKNTSFIVVASRADPLHDDGQQLALELMSICGNERKNGRSVVTYIDTTGDHTTGLIFDKEKHAEAMDTLRRCVFGD